MNSKRLTKTARDRIEAALPRDERGREPYLQWVPGSTGNWRVDGDDVRTEADLAALVAALGQPTTNLTDTLASLEQRALGVAGEAECLAQALHAAYLAVRAGGVLDLEPIREGVYSVQMLLDDLDLDGIETELDEAQEAAEAA